MNSIITLLKTERIIDYNKTSIIKTVVSISMCLFIILKLCAPVSAEASKFDKHYEIGRGDRIYDYDDLLSRYRINSVTFRRNILNYQIEALNGDLADENHINIKSQHIDVLGKIEELKQAKDALLAYKNDLLSQKNQVVTGSAITADITLTESNQELINEINNQIANIDLQLQQYNSTKSSLETNLSDAKLSKNISNFYIGYQSLLESEAKKKLENDFLKQCYSLIIYQEQLDYYRTYQEYLILINKIDAIRYRYGLVNEIDLDVGEVNLLHNERVITENFNTLEAGIKVIKRDTGIMDESKIKLPLYYNKKEYNVESTIRRFIDNYSGYKQIQNYISSYQDYRDTAKMASYTSYRQTELRIDYYKLQKKEMEDSIREYVTNAVNAYENAISSREASWKELQVRTSQYNSLVAKQKYKRASQLEVAKSLYEKEAVELAYYQSLYDSVVWQDILDNHIYGVMP